MWDKGLRVYGMGHNRGIEGRALSLDSLMLSLGSML